MFKKILRWTLIALVGTLAALSIANAIFVWRSGIALENRLQAIRDAGDPVSMGDLARSPIPADDNAATFLRRAETGVNTIQMELAAFYEANKDADRAQLGPAEIETLRKVLDAHRDTVALLEQAAACPDYDPQLDYTLASSEFLEEMLRLASNKAALRILDHQATVLLHEGRSDDAARTALGMLGLSRKFEQNPLLVGHMMTTACRWLSCAVTNHVLRSGPISDAVRDALDAELAKQDPMAALARALKTERAYGVLAIQDLGLGRIWPARGFWNGTVVYYLDVMGEQIGWAESRPIRPQDWASQVPRPNNPWTGMTDVLQPAIQVARDADYRAVATLRCLGILNTITRLEQSGATIAELADLKLPEQLTTDPFTGHRLILKRKPEGWLIYSVGLNGQDDGGQFDKELDVGLGPVAKREPSPTD
jgi:hypothetical protein